MHQDEITVTTQGRGSYDITHDISAIVDASKVEIGLCHLFIRHTSASLMLCENADPDVRRDLETFMSDLVPDGDPRFLHTDEGPDDMPAHVRSVLTSTDMSIPIRNNRMALGSWQGIYLWEHRSIPHQRNIIVTLQS